MRIVTCTNSGVRSEAGVAGPDLVPLSPGGVVPMVAALMRHYGGDWVFIGNGDQRFSQSITIDGVTTTLHAHRVDRDLAEQHHLRISIEILQWLLHYLHDTSRTPLFDQRTWAAWAGYRQVNRQIAGRLHDLCGGDDDIVLINDHQFLLVPGFLRQLPARRCAAVVYFHQLPWCRSDYLALLPHEARNQILTSLLTCDVVGFHARRWTEAFLSCCARYLPSAQVSDAEVVLDGHTTRVVVAPGPVNGPTLARLAEDPHTNQWRERLAGRAAGRRILIRAERFDLWKNVARGLLAYECLLQRRPRLAREVWFCALLSPTRRPTPRHLGERRDVAAIVARINDRHGGAGPQPVSVLWGQPGDNSQHRVVAALQLSSTTLVNPTYDGLNLVAKESLLFAPAAPVVLSVNAGAYETLAPYTVGIDPFDVSATATAVGAALDGQVRTRRWPGTLGDESAQAWFDRILGSPAPAVARHQGLGDGAQHRRGPVPP
jgi:trehalose 6-phosphate synthase